MILRRRNWTYYSKTFVCLQESTWPALSQFTSIECERSFSVLLSQLTHNRLQSRLNHELILVAHSARPVDMDDVHYHASQKYTTFTAIRFITFTVSHIHTVTEPLTHCQSREFGFAPNFIKQMFAHPGLKPCRCP